MKRRSLSGFSHDRFISIRGTLSHRAAALSSDCCVKSEIHSIISGIKRKICVPELEQRWRFLCTSSFLDADAGFSERGTLLKQP